MFLISVFAFIALAVAGRNFEPQHPGMDYNKNRVWFWLNPKCFAQESDVRSFKDYLLSKYECIDFDENRKKIYKHPISNNSNVWSLWLELDNDFWNFECLNNNITLPKNIISECITNVYYEPLQHIDQTGNCATQPASNELWSLDLMDGVQNNLYQYFEFETTPQPVEAIVLDTDVDSFHVEFVGINTNNLFTGNLNPQTSQNHGTHVAGTVVGSRVGGAKNTNLNYYATCQLGSSCAWSDIEGGYEAAIALMLANPNTKYVINYSVGGSRTALNEAAYNNWGQRIQNSGNFWVTSAGNSAADACNFAPAFSTYAIAVGAFSQGYVPTTRFTNYGSCVDSWAPGEMVWSATPGDGYGYSSGTSMASPNIAALVVNLIKNDPTLTLSQIKTKLYEDAVPLVNVPSYFGECRGAYWKTDCTNF